MKKFSLLLVALALYTQVHAAEADEAATTHARRAGSEAYTAAQKAVGTAQEKTASAWDAVKGWWQQITGDTTGYYGAACPGDYGTHVATGTTGATNATGTTGAAGVTGAVGAYGATAGNNLATAGQLADYTTQTE